MRLLELFIHQHLAILIANDENLRAGGDLAAELTDLVQLIVDGGFFSGDGIVRGQKPDKAGIEAILHSIQSPVDETIFIGDRLEKDGKSAEAVGMDYMILDRTPKRLDIGGKNGYL